MTVHRTAEELEAGLGHVRMSPAHSGTVELIACRPAEGEREILDVAQLDRRLGLVGDNWSMRGSIRTPDGSPDPDAQLNLMNARAAALIAGPRQRWALAGDQLYVDLDLSEVSLPAGTRLEVGGAVIEVTSKPHRGCAKFARRFGADALRFVNSEVGVALNLRGRNARVVAPGTVRRGDPVMGTLLVHVRDVVSDQGEDP